MFADSFIELDRIICVAMYIQSIFSLMAEKLEDKNQINLGNDPMITKHKTIRFQMI